MNELENEPDDKKKLERWYLDEMLSKLGLKPDEIVSRESPDFLVTFPGKEARVGVEVTELLRQEAVRSSKRKDSALESACTIYRDNPKNAPLCVSVAYGPEASKLKKRELRDRLLNHLSGHREGSFRGLEVPKGYLYISSRPVASWDGIEWIATWADQVPMATQKDLAQCIAAKESKAARYRRNANEVWLLIVNDDTAHLDGYHLDLGKAMKWDFTFAFDRVLVLRREPGLTALVELRHSEHRSHSPLDRTIS
jgi:hypothetical protein